MTKKPTRFFEHNVKIPEGTRLEFVNVEKKSKEVLRARKESTDLSSYYGVCEKALGQIIKSQGERVYASHFKHR